MDEVEAVRRLLDAFNRRDFSALDELDPRAALQDEPRIPGAGWNYGYQGAIDWAVKLWQSFGRLAFEIDRLVLVDGCLVGRWRAAGVGKRSGIEVDMGGYCLFQMRRKKVSRVEFYESEREALKAARARPPFPRSSRRPKGSVDGSEARGVPARERR